jgi:hypothetical protein
VSSRPARAIQRNPVSKKQNQTNKNKTKQKKRSRKKKKRGTLLNHFEIELNPSDSRIFVVFNNNPFSSVPFGMLALCLEETRVIDQVSAVTDTG